MRRLFLTGGVAAILLAWSGVAGACPTGPSPAAVEAFHASLERYSPVRGTMVVESRQEIEIAGEPYSRITARLTAVDGSRTVYFDLPETIIVTDCTMNFVLPLFIASWTDAVSGTFYLEDADTTGPSRLVHWTSEDRQ